MYLGMPTIVSQGTTFERMIKENNCGYICNSAKDFATIIKEICENRSQLIKKSNNAKKTAQREFSWNKISQESTKEYEKIIGEK